MNTADPAQAYRRFIDFFSDLGGRWGLPPNACRLHAYLYLANGPSTEGEIVSAIGLKPDEVEEAISFLTDYELVDRAGPEAWRTSNDPWEMLTKGLDQRRHRELPEMLETLRCCHGDAIAAGSARSPAARQIAKVVSLVEDLAAIDSRIQRLSPQLLRGLVGISGRAARFVDRRMGPAKRGRT